MVAAVTLRKDGMAEMAFIGETPWHGLGQRLQPGADIDTWKQNAGMDWSVKRSKVRYATSKDHSKLCELPDQHVLFRSDDHTALGVVSSKYKVVQPGEVLEFFRDLVGANGYELETAGTLFDGKRFWALASVGERACVVGDDEIGGYLLLSSSCDGSLATQARFVTVRVVCNNTLTMALQGKASREVVVRHSTHFDADSVKNQLGLARGYFGEFLRQTRRMAKKKVSEEQAGELVGKLLVETKTVFKEDVTTSAAYQGIMNLFNGQGMGAQLAGAERSAWGVVNAVTEFVDHHSRSTTASHRMNSAWFGRGDALKTEAFGRALVLAGG